MSNRFIRACFRCLVIPLISESLQRADESLLFHNVISNSWAAQWLSTPRRGKQADLNPGSRLPGSNFLFIRVCLLEFLLYLGAESPGLAPYFLFRLYSCSMSPVKNPGEIPTPCFQETATKCPIPRQIGFDTKLSEIQDGKPEVTITSLLFNCMWIHPSAHFSPTLNKKTAAADSDLNHQNWGLKHICAWRQMVWMSSFLSHHHSGPWLHFSTVFRQDSDLGTLRTIRQEDLTRYTCQKRLLPRREAFYWGNYWIALHNNFLLFHSTFC